MKSWMKVLPWFVVVWFARRHLERLTTDGLVTVHPFRNGPVLSVKNYPETDR